MQNTNALIGKTIFFNDREFNFSLTARSAIISSMNQFLETYKNIDGMEPLSMQIFKEIFNGNTGSIRNLLKVRAEKEISKAGISLSAIKNQIFEGIDLEMQKLEDALTELRKKINNASSSHEFSLDFDLSLIELTDAEFKYKDNADKFYRDKCSIKINTNNQAEAYQMFLAVKEKWDCFIDSVYKPGPLQKFPLMGNKFQPGIFNADNKTNYLTINPQFIWMMKSLK